MRKRLQIAAVALVIAVAMAEQRLAGVGHGEVLRPIGVAGGQLNMFGATSRLDPPTDPGRGGDDDGGGG